MEQQTLQPPLELPPNFSQILHKYKLEGEKLEEYFKEKNISTAQNIFENIGLQSREELKKELHDPSKEVFLENHFVKADWLEKYQVEVSSGPNGEGAIIIAYDPSAAEHQESADTPENIREIIDHYVEGDAKDTVIGIVWVSADHPNKSYINHPHNGLWVKSTHGGENLGYGLYRLHENIFGEPESEVAGSLSLLKCYLKVGYTPKSIIDSDTGNMTSIPVEKVVEDAVTKNTGRVEYPIYMER